MDLKSFASAIQQIADEKGIPREKIFETIEMALAAAYKRDYGKRGQIIRAKLDPDTGKVAMTQVKIVVDETMIKPEEEEGEEPIPEPPPTGRRHQFEQEDEEVSAEKKVRFNPDRHIMLATVDRPLEHISDAFGICTRSRFLHWRPELHAASFVS